MDDTLRSCRDFSAALASGAPTPGGGGAAALVGALGASLGCMVANLTVGKSRYAAHEPEVKDALSRLDDLRQMLLDLVQKDAEGFSPLAECYRLPPEDPRRTSAARQACEAPLSVMGGCVSALESLSLLAGFGAVSARSDVGCGAAMCRAALESARFTVEINLSMLCKEDIAEIGGQMRRFSERGASLAESIFAAVRG